MKVFVVMGGHYYEGVSAWTMRTFSSRESAKAYSNKLTTDGIKLEDLEKPDIFNFGQIYEQEVED